MAIDYAPEFGTKFTLTGPDGTIATFNDRADANDVGVLSNITGLDSAEVRESGDSLVEFDGGVQGPGYYGRRPVVLEGLVYGHSSAQERAAKLARLHKATNAMRGDSTLTWTPTVDGAIPVFLTLRKQQPLRIDGPWNKTFQAGMVAADPRIYSVAQLTATKADLTPLVVTNEGNAEAWPIYTLMGPSSSTITIGNASSGKNIVTSTTLGFNDVLYIDTLNRTVNKGARVAGSRKNFFPQPDFSAAVSHPFTLTNCTGSIVTATMNTGQPGTSPYKAFAMDPTVSSGSIIASMADAVPGVVAGQKVQMGLSYARATSTGGSAQVLIKYHWKNSSNVEISATGATSNLVAPSNTTWNRYTYEETAPTNTAKVDIEIVILGTFDASTTLYWLDGITLESSAIGTLQNVSNNSLPFFDGTSPVSGFTGLWTGTVGNSASLSYSTAIDTAVAVIPFYSSVNFASTRWSGLMPGSNSLTAGWTTFSPGALFRVDWRHTWL